MSSRKAFEFPRLKVPKGEGRGGASFVVGVCGGRDRDGAAAPAGAAATTAHQKVAASAIGTDDLVGASASGIDDIAGPWLTRTIFEGRGEPRGRWLPAIKLMPVTGIAKIQRARSMRLFVPGATIIIFMIKISVSLMIGCR